MFTGDLAASASIDEVADACRISRSYFSRSFKGSMGLPPHQWLAARRIEAAKRLLAETYETIASIAVRCGFGTQSGLSTRFHRATGMTPRQWRLTFRAGTEQGGWSIAAPGGIPGHIHVQGPSKPVTSDVSDCEVVDATTQLLHGAIVLCTQLQGAAIAPVIQEIGQAFGEHVSAEPMVSPGYLRGERLTTSQFGRAVHLMTTDMSDRASIASIASACGVSHGLFSRAFKARVGVTPRRWRAEKRIDRAKDLLMGGAMTIVDIADECGFSEQSHLNRVFLQIVGSSPGAWRRTHG